MIIMFNKELTFEIVKTIPEGMTLNRMNNEVIEKPLTFVAPTAPKAQLGEFTVKRWTWFESQNASDRAADRTFVKGELADVKTPLNMYYAEQIAVTLRKAPKIFKWKDGGKDKLDHRIKFIKTELDPEVGDIIRNMCGIVNGLTAKEKQGFLKQSPTEEPTDS